MRHHLSLYQTIVAGMALIGISVLGALDKVSSDALIAVYGTVLGTAIGYINGKKAYSNGDS